MIIPRNVRVVDKFRKIIWGGTTPGEQATNKNLGGFSTSPPLFLVGDVVTITSGYRYFDIQSNEVLQTANWFNGFISAVGSQTPIVLEIQDAMWKLKQLPAPNKAYAATNTLEFILQDLLQGTPYTVNALTQTTFGVFRTQNETVAEVLARLRKDYHFESYFRGNELRCGSQVYIEQDAITDGKKVFSFQNNIISDQLEYRRKDDVNLSAIAYSINKNELTATTRDGQTKTRKERLEVLVTYRNGAFVRTVKPPGQKADFAPSSSGERRTLYFWNVTDVNQLGDLAEQELIKYYYTGLRGHFTSFGIPFTQMGDNIDILDPVLPERSGRYKCRKVEYTGGVGGLRQKIYLDYLITRLDAKGNPLS